ncbi:GNAT family N-acetyltransferase [Microlunatus parietis]|uniref:GNAT superfamily N-acetyltransferase n=1 Tax=Microlunatus parietis TaxID=682979 RepID=A0A7Y9LF48_9ACTN|nr:GNAT family N-acetyltransferase [Microlunatus parietis]NYE74488.1 GNAT superfamily N-acetyltransferase [Microlunatus parietis]
MDTVLMRPARADEAELLGDIALLAKGSWGYDQEFLDACRSELTYTEGDLSDRKFVVAESAGRVLGFYSVDGELPEGELGNLWVVPESIGTGLGRRLFEHAADTARNLGFRLLKIEAEPLAEGFYLAMGAVRVGEIASGSIPGRMLPVLRYDVIMKTK